MSFARSFKWDLLSPVWSAYGQMRIEFFDGERIPMFDDAEADAFSVRDRKQEV